MEKLIDVPDAIAVCIKCQQRADLLIHDATSPRALMLCVACAKTCADECVLPDLAAQVAAFERARAE